MSDDSKPQKTKKKKKRRRRRRRTFRFTREGKVFVAVTVGVGLAAVNTGNNLLYLVLGLMLSMLLVSGTLSDLALWRVRIRRRVPARLFANAPSLIEVLLHNGKARFPSYALEVEDRAADEESAERRCFYLKVLARAEQSASYRRVPERRGWLRFEAFVLRTRYPFGLIEKGRRFESPGEVLVYPALIPVDATRTGGGGAGEDIALPVRARSGEIDGVRDYRDGDEARSIHWMRSAALDRLIVREHAREARARVTLLLDEAEPEHDDDDARERWRDDLERAISRAASLADVALSRGTAVEVACRQGRSPLVLPGSSADPIWRFLALLEPVPSADAPSLPASAGRTLVVKGAA